MRMILLVEMFYREARTLLVRIVLLVALFS